MHLPRVGVVPAHRDASERHTMRHQPHIVRVLAALVVVGRYLRELTETPKRWR